MAEFDYIPLLKPFTVTFSRNNQNVTNIWLRSADTLPGNLAPFRLPVDATLVFIAATGNNAANTWDAEVYQNSDVRTGGIPSDGNKIAELPLTTTNSDHIAVNVDISAGTEIGVFMRGTGIDRPRVDLFFVAKR